MEPHEKKVICSNLLLFLTQDYIVQMQINSIRLDMKLVFEFVENMGSADNNSSPDGNKTPEHGKVLNIYFYYVKLICVYAEKMH